MSASVIGLAHTCINYMGTGKRFMTGLPFSSILEPGLRKKYTERNMIEGGGMEH